MSNFKLNLPIDIPWRHLSTSEDMCDKSFCDDSFPPPFQSSISVYVFEPKEEDLPSDIKDGDTRLTYLKISCSITGFQAKSSDAPDLVNLGKEANVDLGRLRNITKEYLGCYGVLLNVSVLPEEEVKEISKYPKIIDFEPKNRELYQAATQSNEFLAGSNNSLSIGKSLSNTETTQNSWNASAGATFPIAEGVTGNVQGGYSHSNTKSQTDNFGITSDSSQDKRESQSFTTHLSQMYNLLTGYHAGTNRATFLMLPRPHTEQPTNRRTFTQGLRMIEGIQDFFLVVSRPKDIKELRVTSLLQTGHYHDNPLIILPQETNNSSDEIEKLHLKRSFNESKDWKDYVLEYPISKIGSGDWILDTGKGQNGVTEKVTMGSRTYNNEEIEYPLETNIKVSSYYVTSGKLVVNLQYKTTYRREGFLNLSKTKTNAKFDRQYTIHLKPNISSESINSYADDSQMIVTQRSLCSTITYKKDEPRYTLAGIGAVSNPLEIYDADILNPIYEQQFVDPIDMISSQMMTSKFMLQTLKGTMTRFNYEKEKPFKLNEFYKTRYFHNKIVQLLPSEILTKTINEIEFIDNEKIENKPILKKSLKESLLDGKLDIISKAIIDNS